MLESLLRIALLAFRFNTAHKNTKIMPRQHVITLTLILTHAVLKVTQGVVILPTLFSTLKITSILRAWKAFLSCTEKCEVEVGPCSFIMLLHIPVLAVA